MAKVRIYNPEGAGWLGTKYEVDGKEVPNVKSVDFHVAVDEIPEFEFHMLGKPDIEMDGNVKFINDLDTIEGAERTLQQELWENEEYKSTCVMALKSILDEIHGQNLKNEELAEAIVEGVKNS